MGRKESISKKPMPGWINQNTKKKKKRTKPGLYDDDKRHSQFIIDELGALAKMFPGTPEFLGKIDYVARRKGFGVIKRKYPDLAKLREEIKRFVNQSTLTSPRQKIRKYLKRYPGYPDLRALNAIQIFNDTAQSGLDAKKTKVLQGALREITRAMYNGGVSLFNINWFLKIYIKYLDSLKEKYQHEYASTRNHYSKSVRVLAESIHRKHLQLSVMLSVRNKLSGLTTLNARLKGSSYILGHINTEDINRASLAIKSEDGGRKIGVDGMTANSIIYIVMTLNLLFARIPILDKMVKKLQHSIPDVSRDIILQKVMVNNTRRVSEFQIAMASGNKNLTHDVARKMYLDCIDIIKQHLDVGVLTKQYEVDPILKAIWIAKESKGLFKDVDYKIKLESSLKLLDIIFSKRVQVSGAYELGRNLQDDIHFIMIEKEWMKP